MKKEKTYGPYHFRIPTKEQRCQALGQFQTESKELTNIFRVVQKQFQIILPPLQQDWLYCQKEKGQTYSNYIKDSHHLLKKNKNKIYILPLEIEIPKEFIQKLRVYCSAFYFGIEVISLPSIDISKIKVGSRIHEGKRQLNMDDISNILQKSKPKDAYCLMAVCITDLYPGEGWNFAFGAACPINKIGVFSFARHDNRFYTQQIYQQNYDEILEDSIATIVHQIGHMFGMEHCIYYQCIMNGANTVKQSRKKPLQLCAVCLRQLYSNIKFDILLRYRSIQELLKKQIKGQMAQRTLKIVSSIISKLQLVIQE